MFHVNWPMHDDATLLTEKTLIKEFRLADVDKNVEALHVLIFFKCAKI